MSEKCPYKVEESGLYPEGCCYDADKTYGNSPLPQCGFPVTLFKVQACSKKLKIKICKECKGRGYIEIKPKEVMTKLGTFQVSDWSKISVFECENGDYWLTVNRRFSWQQIDGIYTTLKLQKKKSFKSKEINSLFPDLTRGSVYYALVILTVKGLLSHSWGLWQLTDKVK